MSPRARLIWNVLPLEFETMEELTDPDRAESKVLADIGAFLSELRDLAKDATSLEDGAERLRRIRASVYENLNQIQHEYLVLQGLRWLRNNGYGDMQLNWSWNPRQTGDATEPDLRARLHARTVVSAEATTSEKPEGVIDSRMRNTLRKLSKMPGRRFYFVRTEAMAQRAATKIAKNSWRIRVVCCDAPAA
jgi:hypothetical protein